MSFIPGDPSTVWDVVDYVNVIWALGAGFMFGATVLLYLNLKYPAASYSPPRVVFALTAALAIAVGTAFFTSQLVEAFVSGDLQSWRIIGRLALWCLFSVAMAAGIALGHHVAIASPNTVHVPGSDAYIKQEEKNS